MKQLTLNYKPDFDPATKLLNFSSYPDFNFGKLYAVINVTANTPIYIAGAPGLGVSQMVSAKSAILQYDTTGQNAGDELNIYYDSDAGYNSNTPQEQGGNLEKINVLLQYVLTELKVLNYQINALMAGPVNGQTTPDPEELRRTVRDAADFEDLGNLN